MVVGVPYGDYRSLLKFDVEGKKSEYNIGGSIVKTVSIIKTIDLWSIALN